MTTTTVAPVKCPVCKTAKYLHTTDTGFKCNGCANTWTDRGKPTRNVEHGYRQPGLVLDPDDPHHQWTDDGHKPGTVTAVWVARHYLKGLR